VAGTDTDQSGTSFTAPGPGHASVALQVVHTQNASAAAVVQCASNTLGGGLVVSAQQTKITALPLDSVTNQALGG
jgi:hypothetical protein